MTTKNSPIAALQSQADRIADIIKRAERGAPLPPPMRALAGRVRAARESKGFLKIALLMDDKNIILEMLWDDIAGTTEPALSAYILKLMQERSDDH